MAIFWSYTSPLYESFSPFFSSQQEFKQDSNKSIHTHVPRQEQPAAEDASPAAVGKLFSEQI